MRRQAHIVLTSNVIRHFSTFRKAGETRLLYLYSHWFHDTNPFGRRSRSAMKSRLPGSFGVYLTHWGHLPTLGDQYIEDRNDTGGTFVFGVSCFRACNFTSFVQLSNIATREIIALSDAEITQIKMIQGMSSYSDDSI
ncbi:hypothetical protein AcW1_007003 [Taiwanofungus camphoratus]|nr:hypothetical protein AcW1_007003 [Antrodia cinnamomea]